MPLSFLSPFDVATRRSRSKAVGYILGGLAVAVAAGVTLLLQPFMSATVFLIPFLAAVFVAAWVGGLGAGLAATALSVVVVNSFFVVPIQSLGVTSREFVRLGVFALAAVFVALLVESRDRLLRRLEEQRQWLLVTLASAGDALVVTDDDARVVFVNPVAEKLLGWSSEEVRGRPLHEVFRIVNELTREPVPDLVAKVMTSGAVVGLANHTLLISRDGREVPIDDSAAPVRDEDGVTRGVVLLFRDITERRRAEEERDRALQEAREANRLKDDFLSTLSHELRTPLNAILGWSQIVLNSSLDADTQRRALQTIARNAEAQSQLIADVLDVSRIVSGKMRLAVQPVDLVRLAADACDTVRPAAEAKGVVLRQVFELASLWLSADPARLQQILWNLLSNAIKFTPRGGEVRLEVGTTDSRVSITVADTGIGIPADFLPRVFERFSQRDSSFARVHGGLGLGLAIVRHLAEAHGGAVTAESAGENRGARFTVQLPIRAVHREAEGEQRADAVPPTTIVDALALAGLSVLVVDDEEDARELVREVLARHGAEVVTASSAGDALQMLPRARFDLLVADIGMPGQDGYDLIRRVRALPSEQGGQVLALAVTAYGRSEDRLRALAAGYQQHLAKPVMPGELVLVAASLFRRQSEPHADGSRPN